MAAEEKRREAWRQVEKSDLVEGNMEVRKTKLSHM
jgi:hypothetical protein